MEKLHLNLVYSVPEGSDFSFVELVNAFSDVLNMKLLDFHYVDFNEINIYKDFK